MIDGQHGIKAGLHMTYTTPCLPAGNFFGETGLVWWSLKTSIFVNHCAFHQENSHGSGIYQENLHVYIYIYIHTCIYTFLLGKQVWSTFKIQKQQGCLQIICKSPRYPDGSYKSSRMCRAALLLINQSYGHMSPKWLWQLEAELLYITYTSSCYSKATSNYLWP